MKKENFELGFWINSYHQADQIINYYKYKNIVPVICIKYYLIHGLSRLWLSEFIIMLSRKYKNANYKLLVDCKLDKGIFFDCIRENINYFLLKLSKSNIKIFKEIEKKIKSKLIQV